MFSFRSDSEAEKASGSESDSDSKNKFRFHLVLEIKPCMFSKVLVRISKIPVQNSIFFSKFLPA